MWQLIWFVDVNNLLNAFLNYSMMYLYNHHVVKFIISLTSFIQILVFYILEVSLITFIVITFVCGCLLSPYGMHVMAPTQLCPFGWYVIPTGHSPQKSPRKNLKIGFPLSLPQPCPLTSDPWPHYVLYWLGTNWWDLSLAHASLPCASKICLMLIRLPWLVCTVCHSFLTIFWFLFPLWLALFGAGPCLMVGFAFSSAHPSCYYLLPYHSIVPAAKLFCFKLAGPFWDCHLFFP